MAAKRVPYTPKKQEANARLASTQLPPEAQTAVRQQLRDTLGYLNLHHHGAKRGANTYLLNDDPKAYGSYDMATGDIHMQEEVHNRAMAFLREHPDVTTNILQGVQTEAGPDVVISSRLLPTAVEDISADEAESEVAAEKA